MGYQLPELVDAARDETTTGEITGLVALVVGLLVALPLAAGRADEDLDAEPPGNRASTRRSAWMTSGTSRSRIVADYQRTAPGSPPSPSL